MDPYQISLTIVLLLLFALTVRVETRVLALGGFPFISFVGAYYFLFHGAISSYVAAYVDHLPFPREISFETFAYSAAFAGAVVAGLVIGVRLPFGALSRSDNLGVGRGQIRAASLLTALIMMSIHFSFYAFPVLSSLPSLPQLRAPSWNCAFAILSYWVLSGKRPWWVIAGLGLFLLFKFWLDSKVGLITPLVFTCTIFAAASLLCKKFKLFLLSLLLGTIIVLGNGYIKSYSQVVLGDQPQRLLYQFSSKFSASNILASFNAAARRSSHSLITEVALSKTPEHVAFSDHNPVADAFLNHIPRFLWRDKPREVLGNEFGKRYKILQPDDNKTSWNLPWAVDFFIAYGIYLAVVVSFSVNIVIGIGVRWMSRRSEREIGFGIYAAVLLPLFYQESNFSLMTGNFLSLFVVIYLIHQASKAALNQVVKVTQANPL